MRFALVLIGLLLAADASAAGLRHTGGGFPAAGAFDCSQLSITYGTPWKYNQNTGNPTNYGDIYFNTWDDQGRNVLVNNDAGYWGPAESGPGSNFRVNLLNGTTTAAIGSTLNAMAPWGTNGQLDTTPGGGDGFDFKAGGVLSMHGTLYLLANRATASNPGSPYQYMLQNGQLIKSTDHGVTFNPQPSPTAARYNPSMFTGFAMANADFLQYGQDYQGTGALPGGAKPHGSDTYVYAYATEGPYNNANDVYLGRVLISAIGNLLASDWSYLNSSDGSSWTSTWPGIPIMSGLKTFGASVGTQYLPAYGCYLRINWWYQSVLANVGFDTSKTVWQPWISPTPWGPWVPIPTVKAWKATHPTPGVGLFSPHIMPASVATPPIMALTVGDFMTDNPTNGDYTLTMVPITVGTAGPLSSGSTGAAAWDPSSANTDGSIQITTTNSTNDTATQSGAPSAFKSARSIGASYRVGTPHKVVASFQIVAASTTGSQTGNGTLVGLMGAQHQLSSYVGSDTPGWGTEGGTGGDYQDAWGPATNCSGGSGLNWQTGATVWIATDFNTGKVWCSTNCTSWISGTPAGGTSWPMSLPMGTGPYFLGWTGGNYGTNDKVVLNGAPNLASCTGLDSTWHTWNAG